MWKYKKEILLASFMSMLVLGYSMLIYKKMDNRVLNIQMFNDYTFMFVFSASIFYLFFNQYPNEMILYKFEKVKTYFLYKLLEFITSISVFIGLLTIAQTIIFVLIDPLFKLHLLIYRNFIILYIAILFYMLALMGQQKYLTRRIIGLFLLWNLLYVIFLFKPNSIVNVIGIFNALKSIKLDMLLKLLLLGIGISYTLFIRIDTMGRKMIGG